MTTSPDRTTPAASTGHPRGLHWLLVVAVLLVLAAGAGTWRLTGGRWYVVETPSMGRAAPVGTLVVTRPVSVGDLHRGDVITFRPPGPGQRVHTHRVFAIVDGQVITKGDANGSPDPGRLRGAQIIGRSVALVPGIGWLIRALPLLALGTVVVWLATARLVRPPWRIPLRLVLVPAVVALGCAVYRPFVGFDTVATRSDGSVVDVTLVSTGLLPTRIDGPHGDHVDLRSGQLDQLVTHAVDRTGRIPMTASLHMPWSWWLIALAICGIPLWWVLLAGVSRPPAPEEAAA